MAVGCARGAHALAAYHCSCGTDKMVWPITRGCRLDAIVGYACVRASLWRTAMSAGCSLWCDERSGRIVVHTPPTKNRSTHTHTHLPAHERPQSSGSHHHAEGPRHRMRVSARPCAAPRANHTVHGPRVCVCVLLAHGHIANGTGCWHTRGVRIALPCRVRVGCAPIARPSVCTPVAQAAPHPHTPKHL